MQKQVGSFRLSVDTLKQLDELSAATRIPRAELLTQLIAEAYDKLQGNPKIKSVLDDLQKINALLEQLDYKLKS